MSKFIEIGDALVNLDEVRVIELSHWYQTILNIKAEGEEEEGHKILFIKIVFKDGSQTEVCGSTVETEKELKRAYKKAKKILLKEESEE